MKLGVVDLGVEKAELPNGVTVDLAVIRHPGASAIVALDEHRRVTLAAPVASRDGRLDVGDSSWMPARGRKRASMCRA